MHTPLLSGHVPVPGQHQRRRRRTPAAATRQVTIYCSLVVLLAAALVAAATPVNAAEVDFANDSATVHFTDVDLQLFRNTLGNVLENDMDGHARRWINPATGNNGRIKIIRTLSPKEPRCRLVRIGNTIKNRDLKTSNVYTYCRDNEAGWAVQSGASNPPAPPDTDR